MNKDFIVSKIKYQYSNDITSNFDAWMMCQGKECHCYGKICLVSESGKGNCSSGNIFVNGRAFCASEGLSRSFGKAVCQELGFQDIVGAPAVNR